MNLKKWLLGGAAALGAYALWKKLSTDAAIAAKAAVVVTNVSPATLPAVPVAGVVELGVIPRDGVSTDDVVAAINRLTTNKLGLGGAATVAPNAVKFTAAAGSRTLVQKSWNVSVLPADVKTVVAYVKYALEPLGFTEPAVAFSSAVIRAAA